MATAYRGRMGSLEPVVGRVQPRRVIFGVVALLGAVFFSSAASGTGMTVTATVQSYVLSPRVVYAGSGDTVTWTNIDSPGQTSHSIVADDGSFDSGPIASGKTFSHTFASPGTFGVHDGTVNFAVTQQVVIQSSAELPKVFFDGDNNYAIGGCGLLVRLTRPAPSVATVKYSTKSGSAHPGSDYVATTGTLQFDPGQYEKRIGIETFYPTAGDGGAERFSVVLSNPTNLSVSDGKAICTMANPT